jgi:hypothetical protein
MEITILTEEELRECVKMDEAALEAVAEGLPSWLRGKWFCRQF